MVISLSPEIKALVDGRPETNEIRTMKEFGKSDLGSCLIELIARASNF